MSRKHQDNRWSENLRKNRLDKAQEKQRNKRKERAWVLEFIKPVKSRINIGPDPAMTEAQLARMEFDRLDTTQRSIPKRKIQ